MAKKYELIQRGIYKMESGSYQLKRSYKGKLRNSTWETLEEARIQDEAYDRMKEISSKK